MRSILSAGVRMNRWLPAALLFLVAFAALPAHGQECPKPNDDHGPSTPSRPLKLTGQLVYHDGLRQWFELKLDQPQCGQASTELVPDDVDDRRDWKQFQVLRGCRVISEGPVDFSPTGYYSLDTYQQVRHIEPLGACEPKPPFPDYSKARPDKNVRRYRVDMYVDFAAGDHPIRFRVTSAGKELRPWQAYARYALTGGFALWGHCGEGFAAAKAFGTPQAHPAHSDGLAAFDPVNAAKQGRINMHLGYICVRATSRTPD